MRRLGALLRRRRELVGINRRNVELVYAENPRRHYPIADDKLLCKEHLVRGGVPVSATVAVCAGLYDIPRVLALLGERGQFVLKPAHGSGGAGILVVGERLGPGRWRRAGGVELGAGELHRHLAEIVFGRYSGDLDDRAFVEDRIVPHETFHALWADGLCDVRVITWRARPVMAMVRVPTAQSGGRANLHQGGLGLALDLASGRTVRAVHRGRAVTHHPESGAPLLGLAMPAWDDVLAVARAAAAAVPLGYLGVDVVVDRERGALVLEINARPGLEIQNVHGRGLAAAIAAVSGEARA
jgi:alpha-L-glutamate ligase-like protein